MELPRDLVKEFAQVTVYEDKKPQESTVPGTTVSYEGKIYVKLDGSDQLTPISTTTTVGPNQRVSVLIKNHTATVTGNYTDPSASNSQVTEIGDQISEFEVVIADKVDTEELNAQIGRIDQLVSDNITVNGKLDAAEAEIDDLTAQNATITGNLEAANAEIENLKATKIDADIVEANYATIENLEATNADIHNLEVDYGSFKDVATDTLEANSAEIDNLKATKLDAEDADILYANIDFANIGEAAIENLFSKSGIIGDLVMSDGHVTGTLVGVTIKGDLIEGGTVVADKLVIQGEDGLYYKLNTTGETVSAEQTDYNSLNGSVITAKSITAEKVAVDDLVAFGATIGGFHITESALYSGVKASANNTTRGTFMNDDGEFAVGDGNNYIKFFKDTDGQYKLAISASSLKFGTSGPAIDEAITSTIEEFYQSDSSTSLTGGSWSETQPTWTQGKFIWRRTKVTYLNGVVDYTPDQNGVCITGNTGPQGPKGDNGDPGEKGDDGDPGVGVSSSEVAYQAGASGTVIPSGIWSSTVVSVPEGQYLWTRVTLTYTDGSETVSYSVSKNGSKGANGEDGNGIASYEITYKAGSSQTTQPTGTWSSTIPTLSVDLPYLWTKTVLTYDNGSKSTSYSVSSTLDSIDVGGRNLALRSNVEYTNSLYNIASYDISPSEGTVLSTGYGCLVENEEYMLTVCWTPNENVTEIAPFLSMGNSRLGTIYANGTEKQTASVKIIATYKSGQEPSDNAYNAQLRFFVLPNPEETTDSGDSTIHWIKVEKGNIATDWSPAPEDVQNDINNSKEEIMSQTNAAIEVSQDNITSKVETEYYKKDDIDSKIGEISTQVTQTNDQLSINFTTLSDTIENIQNSTNESFDEINKYIRFIDGNIVIGVEGNSLILRISNDRISFLESSNEVAYMSNNKLYIQDGEILDRFMIGRFAFYPRDNGNMTLRYI